MFCVN